MPTKAPLNAVIHGRIDRDEYTIDKVYFESIPGFYGTGNLYRPNHITGRVPPVLSAHGHAQDARLAFSPPDKPRSSIANSVFAPRAHEVLSLITVVRSGKTGGHSTPPRTSCLQVETARGQSPSQ